ncbi:ROK family transcriptional regulator [Jatrophihabitans sp. YIM 134969]
MTAPKPSLELLRSLSDANVLQALIDARRATRAELATLAGISKPTVAESVRRLEVAGVVVDTGERTTGPGRVGTYYAVARSVGVALAVGIAPGGVVAEALDVHGEVRARAESEVARPARPRDVAASLRAVARRVARDAAVPVRLAVVSAADPVDRGFGRLVHLPDAPFLVGELSPASVLDAVVDGEVVVDNDVNWAARAERAAAGPGLDDVTYLHLGEGLGAAVVSDGEVRRGHGGLAGEIAHLVTTGPGGRAMAFTEVFAALGLRREASTAIDVPALLEAFAGRSARSRSVTAAVATAVTGVVAAAVGLADPAVVVLGGTWGVVPEVVDAVAGGVAGLARPVPVRAAAVVVEPSLSGARAHAVDALRRHVTEYRQHRPT